MFKFESYDTILILICCFLLTIAIGQARKAIIHEIHSLPAMVACDELNPNNP